MFRIPVKQLIVNNNTTQLLIKKYDGSGTYVNIGSPLLASSGFYLEGFLQPTLFGSLVVNAAASRILAVAGSTGNVQISTYVANAVSAGNPSSEGFRIVYQNLKLSGVEYQNQPLEKHYQLSATLGATPGANAVASAITNAINADKNAPVTATVSTATVTLTGKEVGTTFTLYNTPSNRYVPGLVSGTQTVTQAASLDINTYNSLKTLKFSDNGQVDFDRNAEFFPVVGTTYKGYTFTVQSTGFTSSQLIPSQLPHPTAQTQFQLWIANGLTLQTVMDLVVANANAAT